MLLSYAKAGLLVGVHEQTIRRRVRNGALKSYQEGVYDRVDSREVQALFSPTPSTAVPKNIGCRVIAVVNQKGGSGKTTTTANLAAALAIQGFRVLAIDDDQQGNLTQALGPNPDTLKTSLYNVLVDGAAIRNAILTPVMSIENLSLVGSNLDLADADMATMNILSRESLLKNALAPVLNDYDYIVIDGPPTLGILTINALLAATEVIVPFDMGVFSVRAVGKLFDTISKVKAVNTSLWSVRTLANQVTTTLLSSDVVDKIENTYGAGLLSTRIPRYTAIGEAQARRVPICIYSPSAKAAQAYFNLAKEINDDAPEA